MLADQILESLHDALDRSFDILSGGGPVLDAVVEAVVCLEDSGCFNAGLGAVATISGEIELDAGVMDGDSGAVGGICASRYPFNPVRVARAVAEVGGLPDGPILLAGMGADDFARLGGFAQRTSPGDDLGGAPSGDPPARVSPLSGESHGTVGAVAVDAHGGIAAATSTGGRAGQRAGRVGDSPIPGAGVWARRGSVAVSATGAGECFVVSSFARRVDLAVSSGVPLEEAVDAALAEVALLGGSGGAVAIEPSGVFAARFATAGMARGWQDRLHRVALVLAEAR